MSTEYALPPEPPIGTVVHGKRWDYIRRDVDSPRCWAAGHHPNDLMTIPAWTWGEVLNDGPVSLVQSPQTGVPVMTAVADTPTGDFVFLADPLALLADEQERDLREDLAELARLRRETESNGGSLPLA